MDTATDWVLLTTIISLCASSCEAQTTITVSSPQYTIVHYVLMAASVFVFASLVLGILLLVRKDCARLSKTKKKKSPRKRQQVIKVQPKIAGPDAPDFNVSDQELIIEDVDGHLIRTVAPCKRAAS